MAPRKWIWFQIMLQQLLYTGPQTFLGPALRVYHFKQITFSAVVHEDRHLDRFLHRPWHSNSKLVRDLTVLLIEPLVGSKKEIYFLIVLNSLDFYLYYVWNNKPLWLTVVIIYGSGNTEYVRRTSANKSFCLLLRKD